MYLFLNCPNVTKYRKENCFTKISDTYSSYMYIIMFVYKNNKQEHFTE